MALVSESVVRKARLEIVEKTKREIEKETAVKWAARAIATHMSDGRVVANAHREEDYAHEAIEHAAMAGPEFLKSIITELEGHGIEL